MAAARRIQVGTGDRSENQNHNFPQGRVTDHRINLTLHKLDRHTWELDELVALTHRPSRKIKGVIRMVSRDGLPTVSECCSGQSFFKPNRLEIDIIGP